MFLYKKSKSQWLIKFISNHFGVFARFFLKSARTLRGTRDRDTWYGREQCWFYCFCKTHLQRVSCPSFGFTMLWTFQHKKMM